MEMNEEQKERVKRERTEFLENKLPASIHNHTYDIEKAFERSKTLYKRTNSPQAENVKHHLAIALGELKKASEWADAIKEPFSPPDFKSTRRKL